MIGKSRYKAVEKGEEKEGDKTFLGKVPLQVGEGESLLVEKEELWNEGCGSKMDSVSMPRGPYPLRERGFGGIFTEAGGFHRVNTARSKGRRFDALDQEADRNDVGDRRVSRGEALTS